MGLQETITELRNETQKGFNWTEEQRDLTQKQTIEECQKAIVEDILKQLPNDQGKKIIRRIRAATVTISEKSDEGKKKKKKNDKGKQRMEAANFFEIPPLSDQEDEDLHTQTSDKPSDDDDDNDDDNNDAGGGGGCGCGGGPKNGKEHLPTPTPPLTDHEVFAALLAQILKKVIPTQKQDTGRRLPVKAPETFNSEFVKFRGWWKSITRYLRIYASHIPGDTTRIDVVSTYFKDNALLGYEARERLLDLRRSQVTWKAFSSKLEKRFTDKQGIAKDHKRILALKYEGSIQTFFAKLDELNSRVGLNGEAYKKVITDIMPSDMFDIIFKKYGTIPSNEKDLRSVVMKAGIIIEERELARPKRSQPTNPSPSWSKDKGQDAGRGKETEQSSPTQKGANTQGKDKAPEKTGGKGGQVPKDKYPDQEILWPSFADAMKEVPAQEFAKHRENDCDYRRCGRNTHKTRACFAQKTISGTKLPDTPKQPSGKPASAGSNRKAKDEEESEKPTPRKKVKTAAVQKKTWQQENSTDSESESDTTITDF